MPETNIDSTLCRRLALTFTPSARARSEIKEGFLILHPHDPWKLPSPEEIDWLADPFEDRNWRTQLNMLRWLELYRLEAERGDLFAMERWIGYAKSWISQNPSSLASARHDSWMDMQDGMRARSLIAGLPLVKQYSPQDLPVILESLREHGQWIMDERKPGHHNHALHQHQGLAALGAVLGEPKWLETASQRLRKLFDESWDDEGINAEGAIQYHLFNYRWWQEAVEVFAAAGVDMSFIPSRLQDVPTALSHATRPDGTLVTIGDTDPAPLQRLNHPAIQWVTTNGSEGEPPEDLVKVYKDGYLYARSGWGEFERSFQDETFWSMTFGRFKVHGHDDGGSVTYSASGVNWIVDPGKYSYSHETPIRRHMVAHDSHSLVYLEGLKHSHNLPVELSRSELSESTYDFTVLDYGYENTVIERRVVYSVLGEYLMVIDTVRRDGPISAVQRWQLGAGVDAKADGFHVALSSGEQHARLAASGTTPDVEVRYNEKGSCEGLISGGWKRAVPAPVVEFRKRGHRHLRFITILASGSRAQPEIERVRGLPSDILAFRVNTQRRQETLVVAQESSVCLVGAASNTEILDQIGRPNPRSVLATHTSVDHRAEAASLCRAASDAIWKGAAMETRARLAKDLVSLADNLGVFDLGLRARSADLLERMSPDPHAPTIRGALVSAANQPLWKPTTYPFRVISHRSRFDPSLAVEDAVHAVDLGEIVLPMLHLRGEEPVLTVWFHGALDRGKARLPMFQRLTSQRRLEVGHHLTVSDPTLDLSATMRLGWYLGTDSVDLHKTIANAISELMSYHRLKHLILRGSSGGGFAALQVGAFLPDALVAVDDPQTDIRRYIRRTQDECYQAVFGLDMAPTAPSSIKRLSVLDRYETVGVPRRIDYQVNTGDRTHITQHANPFSEGLAKRGLSASLRRDEVDLGSGHRAASLESWHRRLVAQYAEFGYEAAPFPGDSQ